MRRIMALTFAALVLAGGTAHAASIGVGAFGGMSFPILQDDADNGSLFGVRFPVHVVPLFAVEPYWASSSLGDKTVDLGGGLTVTRQGFDVKAYGVNAMLTTGGPVQFYPFVGIGSSKLSRTGSDQTLTTYDFGVGLGLSPIPKLSVQVRGELDAAVDNGASRKFANVTVGASYALISLP